MPNSVLSKLKKLQEKALASFCLISLHCLRPEKKPVHQGKMKGNSAYKTHFLVNHKNVILLLIGGWVAP